MEEIRGFIFLGRGAEKHKAFTSFYLFSMSALLANILLNHAYGFYSDKHVELTLHDVIYFMLSQQGVLFITVCAMLAGAHYVLMPLVIHPLLFLVRGAFNLGGNLFFYLIYLIMTKVFRLKAENKFTYIHESELLNYLLYLVRVCHYRKGYIVRNRHFESYKWYVLHIMNPVKNTAQHIWLSAALLLSTWAVLHHYHSFQTAPFIYYTVVFVALCYVANAIIAAWIIKTPDYFYRFITDSINYMDSLKIIK